MKTKKIKIIVSIILIFVTLVAIILTALSLNLTNYAMKINSPSRIVVYNNKESGNIVYEASDVQFSKIYSLVMDAYKQPILKAFVNGDLNKNVKIVENETTSIDFSGIKISFVYDTPQAVKFKSKLYTNNGEVYWYQTLVFSIANSDKFNYQSIAIIPPESATYYMGQNLYSLHYEAFANFGQTYDYVLDLF